MADLVALVTGGSGGIGAATCRALAAQGSTVLVGYRSGREAAQEVADACGNGSLAVELDVTQPDSVTAAMASATEVGRLGVLVNNAGISLDDLLLRMDVEDFDRTIDVNLRGTFLTTKAAIRPMLRARWGRIITVSSIVGVTGNAGQTAYAAAKAGLIGFTKSLAREVATKNITANVVAPGLVETAMTADLPDAARAALLGATPIGRAVTAEEVAAVIAFLASDAAAAITGAVIPVDGGAAM